MNATSLATLIASITSVVTAVSSLIGILKTHGRVNDVKADTEIIKNGKEGETHDTTQSP